MATQQTDSIHAVERFFFWLWEYQRRNAGFQKTMEKEVEKLRILSNSSDPILSEKPPPGYFYRFMQLEGTRSIDWECEQRLEEFNAWITIARDGIIRQGLLHSGCRMISKESTSADLVVAVVKKAGLPRLQIEVVDTPRNTVQVLEPPSGGRPANLNVDFDAPLDTIFSDLKHLHDYYNLENYSVASRLEYISIILRLEGHSLGRLSGDYSRAKGLYIWDRVHADGLTQSAAVEQLAHLLPRGDIELEDELWRYRITSECIEKIDVVPMRKRRN